MSRPIAHAPGRQLRSLPELRDIVTQVDVGLEALCQLLDRAGANHVEAGLVHVLLAPLRRQLTEAACDLNDMRL
jgi:hypothetical protein